MDNSTSYTIGGISYTIKPEVTPQGLMVTVNGKHDVFISGKLDGGRPIVGEREAKAPST